MVHVHAGKLLTHFVCFQRKIIALTTQPQTDPFSLPFLKFSQGWTPLAEFVALFRMAGVVLTGMESGLDLAPLPLGNEVDHSVNCRHM